MGLSPAGHAFCQARKTASIKVQICDLLRTLVLCTIPLMLRGGRTLNLRDESC